MDFFITKQIIQKVVNHLMWNYIFDESLFRYIAPIGWEHINLLEEYNFDAQINGLIQSNFNFSKALTSPVTEEAVTMEEPKKSSWIKRIFEKSNK